MTYKTSNAPHFHGGANDCRSAQAQSGSPAEPCCFSAGIEGLPNV
jgi:hypothetical protein